MSDEKIVQALRELFVTWLESRPSFRTTVEVDAAWEGWKANTAVAAMLATHESRAQPASVADWTDEQCIRFMCVGLRHVQYDPEYKGRAGPTVDEIRQGVRAAMESAPPPPAKGNDND